LSRLKPQNSGAIGAVFRVVARVPLSVVNDDLLEVERRNTFKAGNVHA
jgi:hypothetical protein